MRINVINVTGKQKEKTYYVIEVAYKESGGKVSAKKLYSFKYPEVFSTLETASKGDEFDIGLKKEGNYWNWETATPATGAVEVTAERADNGRQKYNGGGNWETSTEREWNRTRIIRQSCINYALAFHGAGVTQEELFETAEEFEKWVNRKNVAQLVSELPDDVVQ